MVAWVWQGGVGAEADRPRDGKIKAARCGPVGRRKNVRLFNDGKRCVRLHAEVHILKSRTTSMPVTHRVGGRHEWRR
jgi:hypothetical protein